MTKDGPRLCGLIALLPMIITLLCWSSSAHGMGSRPPQELTSYARSTQDSDSFIEVINYNVGNVGVDLRLPGFKCPAFKLCWSWTARALRNWFQTIEPDAILLQETMGFEQVFGEEWGGPLLSREQYEGECLSHVCVAWRRDVGAKVQDRCSAYDGPYGELLNCEVAFHGRTVQLISVYYPAVNIVFADVEKRRQERTLMADILFEGKLSVTDPQADLIAGGDFNTAGRTYKDSLPYPENFYTLFGRHVAGYGLSGSAPAHNFFGVYEDHSPRTLSTHYAFGYASKFDQVFANFGFPVRRPDSLNCTGHACLEGHGGLAPLEEVRPGQDGTDHEGIFARVGWLDAAH